MHYETVEYNDAGLIDIEGWVMAGWVPFGVPFEMRGLDPMALVAVKFFADEAAVATQEGQVRYMPAAEFVGLYHKQQGQMRADLLDVALLAAGGLGAVGAASRAMRVIGLVEAAIGGADMVVRSQRAAIEASPEGQAFLAVWEKVVLLAAVYGAAQVAAQLPELVRAARQAWGRVAGKVDPAATRRVEAELARVEGELVAVDHLADAGHIDLRGLPDFDVRQVDGFIARLGNADRLRLIIFR